MSDLSAIVNDRVERLRQLDVDSIRSLPELVIENVQANVSINVNQYHLVASSGEHLVIVQGGQDRWFGISTMIEVGGFAISADGTRRPLTEEERMPYE